MTTNPRQTPQEAAKRLPVTQYLSHRDYLQALYLDLKTRSDAYSYLRFADELGFSMTNLLRLVIVGKRPLTSKAAVKIALALDLHGAERRYWTALVKYGNARLPAERDRLFQLLMTYKTKVQPTELDPLQAEYFSEWYHPVIREMTALAEFNGDPEWIKKRLMFPLRLEQIKRSLELLVQLGVIRFDDGQGRYVRSAERLATDPEVDSLAIVRYHQKMLEIASQSITTVDEAKRDIRAVTVTIPTTLIPLLKGKIEELIASVAALEDQHATGDEVIQVNVQMFPFTK